MSYVADVFTVVLLDTEVPVEPRRHRKRGWSKSAETSAAFQIAWAAREDARKLVRTPRAREINSRKTR